MVGRTISHYRVWEKIGQGAMGVVYKAEDTILRRFVALKFLVPAAAADGDLRARFMREAQAAGSLNHPNICPVYGIEEFEDVLFIVMAYLEGEPLNRVIARGLPLPQALQFATDLADGLREAHAQGIVHRDIKSANVIITTKGRAVLTDFGLAMLTDRSRITRSGMALGTLSYMSPEQALGKRVDRRSDIWSLGVVLHEMVAGGSPFNGNSMQTILRSILNDEPRPARSIRPESPTELDRILTKALAKDPDQRYQHIDDLWVDLRALRRQFRSESPDSPAPSAANPAREQTAEDETLVMPASGLAASARTQAGPPVEDAAPRGAWRLFGALLGAALLLALVAYWWHLLD
jgi:eukaryotic-like serine/threonine-protein kinase